MPESAVCASAIIRFIKHRYDTMDWKHVILFGSLIGMVTPQTACSGAEVRGVLQSSVDSTVSPHTTVVANLELRCKGAVPANYPLYGEFNGKTYTAAQNKENPTKYQISITDETKRFSSSQLTIRVFDEEGYQLIRKGDNNAKPIAVFSHSVRYPYSGPWINSELLIAVSGAVAVYLAHGVRNRMYVKN